MVTVLFFMMSTLSHSSVRQLSNMILSIFLIFVLRIIFVPFASPQSGVLPNHLCIIIGELEAPISGYKFALSDIPERCDAMIYGSYKLDRLPDPLLKVDEDAIKSMVAVKKSVYLLISVLKDKQPWADIFDPKDPAKYDAIVCPLIQKISDLGLCGIVFNIEYLYVIPDYPTKISAFIAKVKERVPTLKFGMSIHAPLAYTNLTDKSLFDFTVINPVIDMYVINLFTHTDCTYETLHDGGGGTIIESSDPAATSMDKLVVVVSQSSMEQSKLVGRVQVTTYLPSESGYVFDTYGKYCQITNPDDICNSCADNNTNLYNEGVYVKKHFPGIAVAWLDYDDYGGCCGCEKYPATKAIFDGFDGVPITPCAKLDVK